MHDYFPGVYWPNLVLHNGLACGAKFDDLHNASAAGRAHLIAGGQDTDPEFVTALYDGHLARAAQLESHAQEALQHGYAFTAGSKYIEAAVFYMVMDFLTHYSDPRKKAALLKARDTFWKGLSMAPGRHAQAQRLEVPLEGEMLDALFVPAQSSEAKVPLVIHLNGTHSTLEWPYLLGLTEYLAQRGIASLTIDHPGSGTAIHAKGMIQRYESEVFVGAIIDFMAQRDDVDTSRIGVCGASMGGYVAPRATIFDNRIAACACLGALYEFPKDLWGLKGDETATMHFTETEMAGLHWSFGAANHAEFLDIVDKFSLEGLMDRMTVPLFVVHGKNDYQIPLEQAERMVREAVNSPRAELCIADEKMGGVEHCNCDNTEPTVLKLADWFGDVFNTRTAR